MPNPPSAEALVELKRMQAAAKAAAVKLAELETEIGKAKYRLSLKEQVDSAMLALQERNHQRMVGMYESLLTEINREVIGGDKVVKLELYTHGGRPSMDIYMENNGNPESIMQGSGGAVANVISVGLRFIALSRINRRKFIVLDEADCWIASDRIPAFANIVSKIGQELGFQVLMISHHPQAYFYEAANTIIQLSKGDEAVVVTPVKQIPDTERDGEIASIHLMNFMSHADSLIPLGSGVTMLQAENDVGKSAVVTALEAITTGAFKKEYIRHGCDYAEVTLTTTDGQSLVCRRVAKTGRNDKYSVSYKLFNKDGQLVQEAPVKDEMPVWALDFMGIRPEQDLDIQIGNQKTPVFLMQESPAKRASILSIGGEISHINAMQAVYKEHVSSDKKKVSEGEPEVGRLRKLIAACEPVEDLLLRHEHLSRLQSTISQTTERIAEIDQLIGKLSKLEGIANIKVPDIPELPDIKDTAEIGQLIKRLSVKDVSVPLLPDFPNLHDIDAANSLVDRLKREVPKLADLPKLPEIHDLSEIDNLVARLNKQIPPGIPDIPKLPELSSAEEILSINDLVRRLEELRNAGRLATSKLTEVDVEMQALAIEINELIDESDGICDACGGVLQKMEIHNDCKQNDHHPH